MLIVSIILVLLAILLSALIRQSLHREMLCSIAILQGDVVSQKSGNLNTALRAYKACVSKVVSFGNGMGKAHLVRSFHYKIRDRPCPRAN